MKKIKKWLSLFLLIFPLYTNAQEPIDGIAAIVGDEVIIRSEVSQFAYNLALQRQIDPQKNPEEFENLLKMSLDNLVMQKILLAKAREDSVTIEETQVDQVLDDQIQNWMKQLGSESKMEEYFGAPVNKIKRQFRDEVRSRLLVEKLQQQYVQKITISRPEVEFFYNTMKDSLPEVQEMVNISHILREIRAGGEGRENAMKKILDLRQRLENGENFAELAKEYSEDPGSAARGGELGFIQRGDFVREFEEVAYNLKPGELSDVVETKFGLHLIQVVERRGEKINARHILIRLQPAEEDAENTRKFLEAVRDSCILGADFAEMAKKYSNDATTAENGGNLGWFELEQLQLPEFKQVTTALQAGEISQPFRTQFGYHIVRLNERREGGRLSLDKNWQQIEQMALRQKQGQKLQAWIDELQRQMYVEIKK